MTLLELQIELKALGCYAGVVDGKYGPMTKAAIVAAFAVGPDTALSEQDILRAAIALNVGVHAIRAVWKVEAGGAGFQDGRPKILPEPHRFSVLTGGIYNKAYPSLSWAKWKPGQYPAAQAVRYDQLASMIGLNVDAGLSACSYGAFQIMGENHALCGFPTPWSFARDMCLTEGKQLDAFVCFLRAKRLDVALRAEDWDTFAAGYNGTAYKLNRYAERLAAAANQ